MRNNILCVIGGLGVGLLCGYFLPRSSNPEKQEIAAKLKEIDANFADLKRAEGDMKAEIAKIRMERVKPAGQIDAANPSGAYANAKIGHRAAWALAQPPSTSCRLRS